MAVLSIILQILGGVALAGIGFLLILFGNEVVGGWREKRRNQAESRRQEQAAREADRLITQALCAVCGTAEAAAQLEQERAVWESGMSEDEGDFWDWYMDLSKLYPFRHVVARKLYDLRKHPDVAEAWERLAVAEEWVDGQGE